MTVIIALIFHFATFLNKAVSQRTIKKPSLKEKALSIPRVKSMKNRRRIQCMPAGSIPKMTGHEEKTNPKPEISNFEMSTF
jgi:hypothetical protein